MIADFSRKQDEIWLDQSLASNFGEVEDAARKYKKGVILDFGSDEIKIPGLKIGKLDKVDFDFL